jgi:hypothetical protein
MLTSQVPKTGNFAQLMTSVCDMVMEGNTGARGDDKYNGLQTLRDSLVLLEELEIR